MNDVINRKLLLDALSAAGVRERASARRIVECTLAVLAARLTTDERETLARGLSPSLRGFVSRRGPAQAFDGDELYRRIAQRARVDAAIAREQAQIVIETIGRHAPYDILRRLSHALPPEVARLLEDRVLGEPAPYEETRPAAQAHSVVLEENPHGHRKLSSGRPSLRPSDSARSTR